MNVLKAFIMCIVSFGLGGLIFFFCNLFHNRGTTDGVGTELEEAGRNNREAERSIEQAQRTGSDIADSVRELTETAGELSESVRTSTNIFEEIRKQKLND